MLYMISYDLIAPGKDYQPLWNALGQLGAKRVLLSQWGLKHSNTSCSQLRDHLKTFMDANDRLIVTRVDDWASWRSQVDINTL